MYDSLLQLFTENTLAIRKAFRWQNILSVRLAAILLASSGKQADVKVMLDAKELLKRNAGVFSNLRGTASLPLIALLSQSERPREALQNTILVQERLKAEGFWRNDYQAIASAQIALIVPSNQYGAVASRAREFYDGMRKNHPFVTGADDYIFSCLLAITSLDVKTTSAKIDELMELLKPHFSGSPNLRQSLVQVLVLGTTSDALNLSPDQAVNRIIDLRNALRALNLKPSSQIASTLGILSLLPGKPDLIAGQVADCFAALKADKGFGKWQGKQITLLFAASLVSYGITGELINTTTNAALSNTITSIIIAQQAAMIAASSSAAAAASSSSS